MADSIRIPASTMSLIVLNATFQVRNQQGINTKMLNELYGKAAANNPEN